MGSKWNYVKRVRNTTGTRRYIIYTSVNCIHYHGWDISARGNHFLFFLNEAIDIYILLPIFSLNMILFS